MFIALVVLVYCGLVAVLKKSLPVALALGLWLTFTGLLAAYGALLDFNSLPPRVGLVILPSLVAAVVFGSGPPLRNWLPKISGRSLVALQSFRFFLELLLASLAGRHLLPEIMTFGGRNFDVLTGLTAPLVAWYCFRAGVVHTRVLIVWNFAGLVLVTNVFAHGMLSAPTRFQVFHTAPPNEIIGTFPYVWLVCFFVPLAYFLHFMSLRKALVSDR